MDNNKQVIVSFGKYKGKPIEQFLQDSSYAKYMLSQAYFKEKYSREYNIVINNFNTEPVDTPEHNEMQVKYLSSDYRLKIAYAVHGDSLFEYNQQHLDSHLPDLIKELEGDGRAYEDLKQALSKLNGRNFLKISDVKFEHKGVDVVYEVEYGYGYMPVPLDSTMNYSAKKAIESMWDYATIKTFRIELKPSIGDDFPAVLRQIKANGSNIVLIKEYTGTGASYEDFKKFFESQGRIVLKQSEVEAVEVPGHDKMISVEKYYGV